MASVNVETMIKRVTINIFLLSGLLGFGNLFAQNNIDYGHGINPWQAATLAPAVLFPPETAGNNHLADPIFQDYIQTILNYSSLPPTNNKADFRDSPGDVKTGLKNSFLSSIKNGLYITEINPKPKGKTDTKIKPVSAERTGGSTDKKEFYSNPLVYKVKFADETGRIDSRVLPLDLFGFGNYPNYIFVQILFKGEDSSEFVDKIAKEAFFKFAGERKILNKGAKTEKILILGWIPYKGFGHIYDDPAVIKVSFEKSRIEFSAMTDISFILKLPYQSERGLFISSFLKDVSKKTGFMFDKAEVFEKKSDIMLITGKATVDKIRDIFQSPFVLQLKLAKQSI